MIVHTTPLPGLCVVELTPHKDERGEFARIFCENELSAFIGNRRIIQINHSITTAIGAIRGMHFQVPPNAEMKLIRCLKGRVWDVAVDLRKGSSTFLQWHAQELSQVNHRVMVIPEGFAHGFQVLESGTELLYLHTASYAPSFEGGCKFDDVMLGISWPLIPTDISLRDRNHANIDSNFQGLVL